MEPIVSRLDVTALFCDVDDFCQQFEQACCRQPQLPSMLKEKQSRSRMRVSEVMTIAIAFHASGFRTLKDFYTLMVLPYWRTAFPTLVSYTRFVELMPWCLMPLCYFLNTRRGAVTGIAFVDSTPLKCAIRRGLMPIKCSTIRSVGAKTRRDGSLALSCI